jgi:hypothetical protein
MLDVAFTVIGGIDHGLFPLPAFGFASKLLVFRAVSRARLNTTRAHGIVAQQRDYGVNVAVAGKPVGANPTHQGGPLWPACAECDVVSSSAAMIALHINCPNDFMGPTGGPGIPLLSGVQ